MDELETSGFPHASKPLELIWEFKGIDQRESLAYALVELRIRPKYETLGYFKADLRFPFHWDEERTVASVRDWALALAKETVTTNGLLVSLSRAQ